MKKNTDKLIALVAEACEAAYRRGYLQAATESDRTGFTSADLETLHRWRYGSPKGKASPPLRGGWSCSAVDRLMMEQPDLMALLQDIEREGRKRLPATRGKAEKSETAQNF
jgi:hypothetical protein